MYRPPSRPPRGAWALHLHAERQARELSQTQAFELVFEGLHLSPKSRAVYAALDMGDRQPTKDEATYLASMFGWPSDSPPEAAGTTESEVSLIAALAAQTAAINALVKHLDTFVGPLGEVVADLLREKLKVATDQIRSGARSS